MLIINLCGFNVSRETLELVCEVLRSEVPDRLSDVRFGYSDSRIVNFQGMSVPYIHVESTVADDRFRVAARIGVRLKLDVSWSRLHDFFPAATDTAKEG